MPTWAYLVLAAAALLLLLTVMTIARSSKEAGEKTCPQCALKVPRAAKICGHCRAVFPTAA